MSEKIKEASPKQAGEFFVRLPRGELLCHRVQQHSGGSLGDFVRNEALMLSERLSLPVTEAAMTGAGIHPGDYVVVEKGKFAEGDILAVRLGEAVLIRRYFRAANRIRLECEPPTQPTIIVEADTPGFVILGRVIQTIREM